MAEVNEAARYIAERAEAEKDGPFGESLATLRDFHHRKLWHQLTTELIRIVGVIPADANVMSDNRSPPPSPLPDLLGLYSNFIRDFETKLNQVALVQLLVAIGRAEAQAPAQALDFLAPHLMSEEDVAKAAAENADRRDYAMLTTSTSALLIAREPEANVLLLSEVAHLRLRSGDSEGCRTLVDRARAIVDSTLDMSAVVHSSFYHVASELYKVVGPATSFYRNALTFLSYTAPEKMPVQDKVQWASDLAIAALVGEDIYNFGELMSHAVLTALEGTPNEWLLRLLQTFNRGSLEDFDAVCKGASEAMNAHPVLVAHADFIRQKITILALMELAFTRSETRSLTYAEISAACRLDAKEVELLLMRALSLKLISGVIDNVDEIVTITRVQPRVLGKDAIAQMANRLDTWCRNVEDTNSFLRTETAELLS